MPRYALRWIDHGVTSPRFTVNDGMLWVVASDAIHEVDALELRAQAELEE